MSVQYIGVYGASGFGREVMPLVRQQYPQLGHDQLVFIDDGDYSNPINGHQVLSFTDFIAHEAGLKAVTIAIANSNVRQKLAEKLTAAGIAHVAINAANVIAMDDIMLGEGSILSPFVCLTSNIRIGKFFHANIYSYVAHDCVIGDYVTFAPGVKCNGNVHIEDHAYIGTGAIIKQGTPEQPVVIGRGAVIGMGAVVTKSVAAGDVVIGNPARSMKKQ